MRPNALQPSILSIALGLVMLLVPSQNLLAASTNLLAFSQQKKPSIASKKNVVKSKNSRTSQSKTKNGKKTNKKVAISKTSTRRYSQKELNRIMRILEKKYLTKEKTPALRNVVGFGLGSNSIDVMLRWNTKEKQQEFRKQICNSPAIKFEGTLSPFIDNKTGVSSYQGISIKAEKPFYPSNTTEVKFTITNHSGKIFWYGERYYLTGQGKDGNWFWLPTENAFNDVAHGIKDGQSTTLTARLYPDILPNKPGTYRFFHEETIDGKKVLFMATFVLK